MESFKDTILRALPDPENSATRLRLKYVGSILSTGNLEKSKFKLTDSDEDEYATWTKLIQGKSYRITLRIAPNGTLCDLRLAWFVDLSNESIGSPYGWYRNDNISKRSETFLSKSIAELTTLSPPENAVEEWTMHLEHLPYDADSWEGPKETDFILCCFVNHYFQEDKTLAMLLLVSLVRHIGEIQNPHVVADLAHRCGRMRMEGECSLAIKRFFVLNKEQTGEEWTNIGAVLCDNLHESYAALQCFKRAIFINKDLPEARQCVWIAGQRLMEEAIIEKDFDQAISVFKEVSSLGDEQQAKHGIWSYAGLTYESLGKRHKAEHFYLKALSVHPECMTSNTALERLRTKSGDDRKWSLSQQVMSLQNKLEYSDLERDD